MIIETFTQGDYTARVFENKTVEVETAGIVFERPGPWRTIEGAIEYAQTIVGKYALDGHKTDEPTA